MRVSGMTRKIALLALLLTAACGSTPAVVTQAVEADPVPKAVPRTVVAPTPEPVTTFWEPSPVPTFRTPEAAMVYLASAWNRGDMTELKHVTDPAAREQLWNMHREATDLALQKCERRDVGDYECTFTHDYPVGYSGDRMAQGKAWVLVGPARRSGWYMTVYEGCG